MNNALKTTGLTAQYMVVLRAFSSGWASDFSEPFSVTTAGDTIAPNAPSDVVISEIVEGLVLGWTNPTLNADETECNDLTWIRVYRSASSSIDIDDPGTYDTRTLVQGETYTYDSGSSSGSGRFYQSVLSADGCEDVTTTVDRGYRDRTEIAHYFVITAIDRTGNESVASTEVYGTPESVSTDDTDAVHTNAAAEISAVAAKAAPVGADYILIEDSEDSDAKKSIQIEDITTDRYLYIRVVDFETATEVADGVGGDVVIIEGMTVLDVGAYVDTAGSGSVTTIDIQEGGSTILSTKITIDAGGKSSKTATTPPVVSDTTLAANGILTINVDGIASGTAADGLTIWLKVRF